MNDERHIILFDGVCNLCNHAVIFIIKKDKKGIFKFASLQSDAGKYFLKETGFPPDLLQSIVYIKSNRHYLRSDAVLEIAKTLRGIWQLAYVFKIVPKFIRNRIYNIIARNRYKWFGKKAECVIPTPGLQRRFL